MKVLSVVGTRPNIMKIAPLAWELKDRGHDHICVHTGQQSQRSMTSEFFKQLGLNYDYNFSLSSTFTYRRDDQVAMIIERLCGLLRMHKPDAVAIPGDVNSSVGGALAAILETIPVAHIEAGLRSFDMSMPEEVNRIIIDRISDWHFTHSPEAESNLTDEGIFPTTIEFVGNIMIDSLIHVMEKAGAVPETCADFGMVPGTYLVVTLHRPSLVDTELLTEVMRYLNQLKEDIPIVFPVHPRTRDQMRKLSLSMEGDDRFRMTDPMDYFSFLGLMKDAKAILTDSGGIQEEATFFRVPCFTLRNSTERPITVKFGTNVLLGLEPKRILEIPNLIHNKKEKNAIVPPYWDGHTAHRIVDILERDLR